MQGLAAEALRRGEIKGLDRIYMMNMI